MIVGEHCGGTECVFSTSFIRKVAEIIIYNFS